MFTASGRRAVTFAAALLVTPMALALNGPAEAMVINVNYDSSVGSAPAGFTSAFQNAVSFFDTTFSNPITVNIGVGWGEVGGSTISAGALGESETYLAGYYSYSQVRNALISDARSSADKAAVATLAVADPTGGKRELMSTSEAKSLGLSSYSGTDGFVGFDKSSSWTFNANNRQVGGAFDFIGVAEHEISEVLGRMSDLGTIGGTLDPLDLFRYTGSGTRQLTAPSGSPCGYFSINGGASGVNGGGNFNCGNGGDLGDWALSGTDAFNAGAPPGIALPVSGTDLTELDVLGYNLSGQQTGTAQIAGGAAGVQTAQAATAVPEPSTLSLLGAAMLGLVLARRGRSA